MTTSATSLSVGRGGLGTTERVLRVVLGGAGVLVGIGWLGASGVLPWLGIGLVLLGLDFVVTGLRGYCPLYARLGIGGPWPASAPADERVSARAGQSPQTDAADAKHDGCC